MKIALAQINAVLGDFEQNKRLILDYLKKAVDSNSDIVVFPEMVVSGYPPLDLLYEKAFIETNLKTLKEISEETQGIVAVIGYVERDEVGHLYNAAAIITDGRLVSTARKTLLPTYDVFDEARYFTPNRMEHISPVEVNISGRTVRIGVEICEDLWDDAYETKVTDILVEKGAELIINISSSPFHAGKRSERLQLMQKKAVKLGVPCLLCNLVGGQDELVFDGQSLAVDATGKVIGLGHAFEEDLIMVDLHQNSSTDSIALPEFDKDDEVFKALVLGIRDYFRKTGFRMATLGLSGGIDSAVAACIAAEALGPQNIIGVSMPSRFSSEHSRTDAEELAEQLGIHYVSFSIQEIVNSYHESLEGPLHDIRSTFSLTPNDDDPVADENIQPRVRGNCLMDFSNRLKDLGILVLNTGNKTELALGYCTLYGDMTGGVGVLGDVSKLQVYSLAKYYNRIKGHEVIPRSSIEKRPSAELKPDQYDPFDFDIVSPLVDDIIEKHKGRRELIELGYPEGIVDDVYGRVRRAEYKRWQAPPCIKITRKAFGLGWKMPIVNHFRG